MRIFFCGDVMTGRGIDQILPSPSKPTLHETFIKDARDYVFLAESVSGKVPRQVADEYIWGDALDVWRQRVPDVKIMNLETTITTSDDLMEGKGVNYRMHPQNKSVLAPANFQVASVANNHILDWGHHGLRDTLAHLRELGIQAVGAGENFDEVRAPVIIDGNPRLLIFALAMESSGVPFEWAASAERYGIFICQSLELREVHGLGELIAKYRLSNDLVILSVHWGGNWGYSVSQEECAFAHALIDVAKVDVVHGHSSHHARPIEIYKNKLIIYGCGDFINDYEGIRQNSQYRGDLVLMYFSDWSESGQLQNLEMVCLQVHKMKLRLAPSEDVVWLKDRLNREGKSLGVALGVKDQNTLFVSNNHLFRK